MATFRGSAAGRSALLGLTAVATLAMVPIAGNALPLVAAAANQASAPDDQTPQPAQGAKPDTDGAQASGKSADSKATTPPQPPNADNRELVRKRMELCRQRPEVCMQEGEKPDRADVRQPPERTSKD